MKIPQYDLDGLGGEFVKTQELEQKIAQMLGVRHAIMVTSGTVAIFLALRASGSRVVAVSALTMFGTAAAADLADCQLRIVSNNELPDDVDTYVHVSLNGRDCGVAELKERYLGITIIEDACQAFGSMHAGKYLGTFGVIGCFSFSPHKILSAGNGGCVVTDDDSLATEIRKLKNFGRAVGGADMHEYMGYNFKFTDIQADFVLDQFAHIDARIASKKRIYERYYRALHKIMLPHESVPWYVDIYVPNRVHMIEHLKQHGIGTRVMYPLLSSQPPLVSSPTHGDSTEDARRASQGLWLPSSLALSDAEIDYVIEKVQERM